MLGRALISLSALASTVSALACQSTDSNGEDPVGSGGAFGSGGNLGSSGAMSAGGQMLPPPPGGTGGVDINPGSGGAPPTMGGAAGESPGMPDGAAPTECEPFVMPGDCTIPDGAVLPGELRCTGLYGNWETRELACGITEYRPAEELWSDGADKIRYVWLPPNETIDVSDPDNFVYPVGTQFWKEFRVGDDKRLGETRLMRKTDLGWLYTAYVWSEDGLTTTQVNDGVENLLSTGHTVPTREQCRECHAGRPDFILGWDFVMLGAGAEGVTRESLAAENRLSGLDGSQTALSAAIPGDEVERTALGYLHANCGVSCHNDSPEALGRLSGLLLRLDASQLESVQATDAVTTGINRTPSPNVELDGLDEPAGPFYDFRPLDPERSLAVAKMNIRGATATPMPPIASNHVDPAGVAAIIAWVNHMTVERGYPEAAP